jgi:hypothetical protein
MQDKAVAMEFEVESAHWMFCVRMGSVWDGGSFLGRRTSLEAEGSQRPGKSIYERKFDFSSNSLH